MSSAPTSDAFGRTPGLDPVGGPGVTISVSGPIDGSGVEELINELRNAGAEAIRGRRRPDRDRWIVVTGARAGPISTGQLADSFELSGPSGHRTS